MLNYYTAKGPKNCNGECQPVWATPGRPRFVLGRDKPRQSGIVHGYLRFFFFLKKKRIIYNKCEIDNDIPLII
jgi:hypothetical protein